MKEKKENFKFEQKKIIMLLMSLACIGIIVFGITLGKTLSETTNPKKSGVIKEIRYCVAEFECDGGTRIDDQEIAEGGKILKPANPVKTGYEFKGWFLAGELYDFDSTISKDIILKAKWESISDSEKVYINFDSNGGTLVETIEAEKGSAIESPLEPSKTGYIFKGWYLNNNLYNFNNLVEENITLLAEWEEVIIENKDEQESISNSKDNNSHKNEQANIKDEINKENDSSEIKIPNNTQTSNKDEETKNEQDNKNENVENSGKNNDEIIYFPGIWQMKVVYKGNGSIVFSGYELGHTEGTEKNLDGIEILRSTSKNGNYEKIAISGINETQCTVTGIDRSIPYYYTARPYKNVNGVKKYGEILFAQYVPAEITNVPSNIYFSTEYGNNMKVTFNHVKGATKYYLIKSEAQNGKYEYVNYSATASINTSWSSKDSYYKIYAYDEAENGQYEIYGPESKVIYIPRNFEDPYLKNIKTSAPYEEVWENGVKVKKYADIISVTFDKLEGASGYYGYLWKGGNITEICNTTIPGFSYDAPSIGDVNVKPYKKGENYLLYGESTVVSKYNPR